VAGPLPAIHQAQPLILPPRSGASARVALPCSFWERLGTLDLLAPSINYSLCRDVVQLYSVRLHSGDMARIRDTALAICRGFLLCAPFG
jgi:hypothetical protein